MDKVKLTTEETSQWVEEILSNTNEDDIRGMIDDAMMDYIDDNWSEDGDYESEYDWYQDYGRGEAESDVVNQLVNDLQKEKSFDLDLDSFCDVCDGIAEQCNIDFN